MKLGRSDIQSLISTALVLVPFVLLCSTPVWCQGSLGAAVTIRSLDTGAERQVITTSNGEYLAPSLQPGRYRISATHRGFRTVLREPVTAANINNSTTFGMIGGQANTARLIQFAAKPIF